MELDADHDLQYRYLISAITAVRGSVDRHGRVVKLIEKITFTPPGSRESGESELIHF